MSLSHDIFAEIYRRHGHRCPMSTLGGRLGHAARRRLPDSGPFRAVYLSRTCAVDGIVCTTGCSEETGNLEVREEGRHVLRLLCPAAGTGVEVALRPAALDIAWEYRRARDTLETEREGLCAAEIAKRKRGLTEVLDEVLGRLRSLPEAALLTVRPVSPSCQREAGHA